MLIGLTGAAGSGKNTAAARLVKAHGFYSLAFADPLYEMVSIVTGLMREDLEDREIKETPIDWLGKSPRQLLQSLGTEWGRGCVRDDLWITIAFRRIDEILDGGRSVVVTDVRFPNEAEAIRERGGVVWRITRPVTSLSASTAAHASEAGIPDALVDAVLPNAGSLAFLAARVDAAIGGVVANTMK